MFQITKLTDADHDKLQDFLSSKKFHPIFDFSPYTLMVWYTHRLKSLYIVRLGDDEALVLHREKNNDVRFMFFEPTEPLLKATMEHFDPQFVAANELIAPTVTNGEYFEQKELSVDVDQVAGLIDKVIRHSYEICQRRHPNLKVERYEEHHVEGVQQFFKEWRDAPAKKDNPFTSTANDEHFMQLYSMRPEVVGIVVKDEERIVGLSFFLPALDGQAIGLMNKCLRGYVQLGVFTYVERVKVMQKFGYKKAYEGIIQSEFKNKFISSGEVVTTYSREIFRKPIFKTHGPYVLKLI